jgi:hypothetical protein
MTNVTLHTVEELRIEVSDKRADEARLLEPTLLIESIIEMNSWIKTQKETLTTNADIRKMGKLTSNQGQIG